MHELCHNKQKKINAEFRTLQNTAGKGEKQKYGGAPGSHRGPGNGLFLEGGAGYLSAYFKSLCLTYHQKPSFVSMCEFL